MLYQEQKNKVQENLDIFKQANPKDTQRILSLANAYWQNLHLDKEYMHQFLNLLDKEACKIPFPKKNTPVVVLSLAPALQSQNTYNQVLIIAISLLLSSMKIPVVLKGDYGYNHEIGLSDILEALGMKLQKDMAENAIILSENNWAYMHMPYAYPSLEDWAGVRADFAKKTVIDQVLPLLPVLEGENIYNLIACSELPQNRFYAHFLNFEKDVKEKTTLLHDNSNTAFLSLCSDFYWQTSSDIEVMYLKDWNLPQLQDNLIKQAQKLSSAQEAALFIENLLKGDMASDWQTLLIVNAAFIAQTVQPQQGLNAVILNAEAALDSHMAYKNLQSLLPKTKKDI